MIAVNIDVDGLLDQTVTVFAKVSAKEVGTDEDEWHRHVLSPAFWSERYTKTTDADGTVHYARAVIVQVPADTAPFLNHREYVQNLTESSVAGAWSLVLGDFLCKGEVPAEGVSGLQDVLAATEGFERCNATAVRDLRNNGAVSTGPGCLKYASVVHAEGA